MLRSLFKGSKSLQANVLNQSKSIIAFNKRFDGAYPWYQSFAQDIPKKNNRIVDDFLDETEVITRILYVMHTYSIYDLEKVDWEKPFDQQGIDSLEATALLTSLEHEFHTIFEDRVFENFENLNQVKNHIVTDHNSF